MILELYSYQYYQQRYHCLPELRCLGLASFIKQYASDRASKIEQYSQVRCSRGRRLSVQCNAGWMKCYKTLKVMPSRETGT